MDEHADRVDVSSSETSDDDDSALELSDDDDVAEPPEPLAEERKALPDHQRAVHSQKEVAVYSSSRFERMRSAWRRRRRKSANDVASPRSRVVGLYASEDGLTRQVSRSSATDRLGDAPSQDDDPNADKGNDQNDDDKRKGNGQAMGAHLTSPSKVGVASSSEGRRLRRRSIVRRAVQRSLAVEATPETEDASSSTLSQVVVYRYARLGTVNAVLHLSRMFGVTIAGARVTLEPFVLRSTTSSWHGFLALWRSHIRRQVRRVLPKLVRKALRPSAFQIGSASSVTKWKSLVAQPPPSSELFVQPYAVRTIIGSRVVGQDVTLSPLALRAAPRDRRSSSNVSSRRHPEAEAVASSDTVVAADAHQETAEAAGKAVECPSVP